MLTHLIIQARSGWCGRIRVIYSGLRVSRFFGAKLTIVSPEGDLRKLIALPQDVDVVPEVPDLDGYERFSCNYNRIRYDFTSIRKAFFCGLGRFEDKSFPPFELPFYADYVRPSAEVLERTVKLKRRLGIPDRYVGMHIRRGDHRQSIRDIPDGMVLECIAGLLQQNPEETIVLGCEDIPFRTLAADLYPGRVIVATEKERAWDSHFDIDAVADDYAELLLLAQGRYVIGCESSAYSRMALACNGNPESYLLGPGKTYFI